MTLENMSKKRDQDKNSFENNPLIIQSQMEQRFRQELQDKMGQSSKQLQEAQEKASSLEKENKQLQHRLQLEQRDKMSNNDSMQKKVEDLQET